MRKYKISEKRSGENKKNGCYKNLKNRNRRNVFRSIKKLDNRLGKGYPAHPERTGYHKNHTHCFFVQCSDFFAIFFSYKTGKKGGDTHFSKKRKNIKHLHY